MRTIYRPAFVVAALCVCFAMAAPVEAGPLMRLFGIGNCGGRGAGGCGSRSASSCNSAAGNCGQASTACRDGVCEVPTARIPVQVSPQLMSATAGVITRQAPPTLQTQQQFSDCGASCAGRRRR